MFCGYGLILHTHYTILANTKIGKVTSLKAYKVLFPKHFLDNTYQILSYRCIVPICKGTELLIGRLGSTAMETVVQSTPNEPSPRDRNKERQ